MKARSILPLGILAFTAGCVAPIPYGPPPPPVYVQGPPVYAPPPAYRCRAFYRTPYGPQRVICPLGRVQPVQTPCACPPPPPPPGYPPAPPVWGRAIP